jgi:hypothetical protein
MSELIITTCDYCNKQQDTRTRDGRGYVVVCEGDAIELFDWKRDASGNIKCLTCQDEEVE